ncbi:MAG: hypothetical protein CMO55_10660 [Verrucomicrobiales bacterium]|nr:hypothetical protein [Verrucomicrobiales bacterium]
MDVASKISEFPDRLSPVLVRDLRQGLKASYFVWVFIIVQSLALLAVLGEWAVFQILGELGNLPVFSGGFIALLGIVFVLILPLSLFGSLQSELGVGRNIDLLLTTRLSRWQIVRSKLAVATSLSALILISILPYQLIRYFMGTVEPVQTFLAMGWLLLTNAAMNAIVIGASGFSNYVGRAAVILFLGIQLMITTSVGLAAMSMRASLGGSSSMPILSLAASILATLLYATLGLQLGRSRIKPYELFFEAPATVLVLAFSFCVPIVSGFASALGGFIGSVAALSVLLVLALLIDRTPKRKKLLIGAPAQSQ